VRVKVEVTRRAEIADPQGVTVLKALHDLGFSEVSSTRFDRTITLEVDGSDPDVARARVEEMCRRLLANPVIEDFAIEVEQ
jgi:phosphoribosylformylglycinamidine synthase PurS subunit